MKKRYVRFKKKNARTVRQKNPSKNTTEPVSTTYHRPSILIGHREAKISLISNMIIYQREHTQRAVSLSSSMEQSYHFLSKSNCLNGFKCIMSVLDILIGKKKIFCLCFIEYILESRKIRKQKFTRQSKIVI